jgi:hypothetical protein
MLRLQIPTWPGVTDIGAQKNSRSADGPGERAMVIATVLTPTCARSVAVCTADRALAVTGKLAEDPPPGTVREAGTTSAVPALDKIETTVPEPGAGAARDTAQIVLMFEVKVPSVHRSEVTLGGFTMESTTALLDPPRAAVTVTFWSVVSAAAVAIKPADVADAGTVTLAGMVSADARLFVRVTLVPPAGAGFERVTVQVVEVDAARTVELQFSEVSDIPATIVRASVLLEEPRLAVRIGD